VSKSTGLPSPLGIIRFGRGMTQTELARRALVARETVARLEANEHRPRATTARAIADVLGVPVTLLWPESSPSKKDARPVREQGAVTTSAGRGRDDEP
jgi:transcriptional regulator with XRE-family HTH domain